jgi:hypothetical protein
MADQDNLSGIKWFNANQAKYPTSDDPAALSGNFKTGVQAFIKALETAGASVHVEATTRHPTRAFLMHYAWRIAKGQSKPVMVPKLPGLDIKWDHGDDKKSQKAAQEMIGPKGFKMAYPAALVSNHEKGLAIDMSISWSSDTLKIKDARGKEVVIKTTPRNGQNKELHAVGKSFGVIKLVKDRPHWSVDGK